VGCPSRLEKRRADLGAVWVSWVRFGVGGPIARATLEGREGKRECAPRGDSFLALIIGNAIDTAVVAL